MLLYNLTISRLQIFLDIKTRLVLGFMDLVGKIEMGGGGGCANALNTPKMLSYQPLNIKNPFTILNANALRVSLGSTYFVEIENFLLKVL